MNTGRALVFAGLLSIGLLGKPALADIITNGNFDSGTLAGWTVFTTSNGITGVGLPAVSSFDTGSGLSNAAEFDVAETIANSSQQGGGLSQTIFAPLGGLYTLTEDFASLDDANGQVNHDAGTFSILIDGVTVASDNLGGFATVGQTLMGSFNQTLDLTAGSHTFETLITRGFTGGGTNTPTQYIDNISLTAVAVATPEPSSIALFGTGIISLAGIARRRFLARS